MLEQLGTSFGIDLGCFMQSLTHHSSQDVEESLALGVLFFLGGPLFGMGLGIVDHRCE